MTTPSVTTPSAIPADFNDFLGNTAAVESLRTAIAAGRLPHALILSGSAGAGKYTLATGPAIEAAAQTVKSVPSDNKLSITNPPSSAKFKNAWPLSTFTYIIMPRTSPKAAELRKMVFWAITQGQTTQYTAKQIFVPIPKIVLVAAEKTLKTIHT